MITFIKIDIEEYSINVNVLESILSSIPPWPGRILEKSLIFRFLLNLLKLKSPINAMKENTTINESDIIHHKLLLTIFSISCAFCLFKNCHPNKDPKYSYLFLKVYKIKNSPDNIKIAEINPIKKPSHVLWGETDLIILCPSKRLPPKYPNVSFDIVNENIMNKVDHVRRHET